MNGAELTKLVCNNIRQIRKAKKIRLKEVAYEMRVVHQQISLFENGKSFPRPQNLCDLAEILGVDVLDFFKKDAVEIVQLKQRIAELEEENSILQIHLRG